MNETINAATLKQPIIAPSSAGTADSSSQNQGYDRVAFGDFSPYGLIDLPADGSPVLRYMTPGMLRTLTKSASNSEQWYQMIQASSYALLSFYEHQRIMAIVASDQNPNGCCNSVKMVIQVMDIEGILHPMLALIERGSYEEALDKHNYRMVFIPAHDIIRYDKVRDYVGTERKIVTAPERRPDALCQIRTFGSFDVFINNQAVSFPSAKSKELLALLIDYRGGYLSTSEAISYLWPDEPMDDTLMARYRKVVARLKATLDENGLGSILISKRSQRRVDLTQVQCDLLEFLSGDQKAVKNFHGIYMQNYEWSEVTCGALSDMLK